MAQSFPGEVFGRAPIMKRRDACFVSAGVKLWKSSRPYQRSCKTRVLPQASASPTPKSRALIFDCDGVIVESEELHRKSYNACWAEFNLGFTWSIPFYEMLQNSIGGGKEKMKWYFENNGWPKDIETEEEREDLISRLHTRKTELYTELIRDGQAPIRPGVLRLMDEAIERGLRLAICSAANATAVHLVLDRVLGKDRLSCFDVVLAGDVVKKKKPDPMIYNIAREKLELPAQNCVVIEDSQIGLQAALAANMNVIITHTQYTASQSFDGARAIYPSLGESEDERSPLVTVDSLFPELLSAPVA